MFSIISTKLRNIPLSEPRRSSRNAFLPHLSYDQKYHPVDACIRPANAKRRKRAHGIVNSDDDEDPPQVMYSEDKKSRGADETLAAKASRNLKITKCREDSRKSRRSSANHSVLYSSLVHPQDSELIESGVITKKRRTISLPRIVLDSDWDASPFEDGQPPVNTAKSASTDRTAFTPISANKTKGARKSQKSPAKDVSCSPTLISHGVLAPSRPRAIKSTRTPKPAHTSKSESSRLQSQNMSALSKLNASAQAYVQAWENFAQEQDPVEYSARAYTQAREAFGAGNAREDDPVSHLHSPAPLDEIHKAANDHGIALGAEDEQYYSVNSPIKTNESHTPNFAIDHHSLSTSAIIGRSTSRAILPENEANDEEYGEEEEYNDDTVKRSEEFQYVDESGAIIETPKIFFPSLSSWPPVNFGHGTVDPPSNLLSFLRHDQAGEELGLSPFKPPIQTEEDLDPESHAVHFDTSADEEEMQNDGPTEVATEPEDEDEDENEDENTLISDSLLMRSTWRTRTARETKRNGM